jgi:glycine/D-amino acid oxidase-like deaminating enzyme
MRAKVVIVGGGVMGAAIAWHAARRNDPLEGPIVLLEKTALAAGSSGRSGAILRQHYADRVVAAMARDSLRVYASLERDTGRAIGFERTGVLTLTGPERPAEIARLERNVAMQIEIGIDTRRVDAREIRELVPGIVVAEGTVGAWEPGAGAVDPRRTVDVLATLAREQGAITRIGVAAQDLVVEANRIVGVETSAGRIDTEQVVIAAGPWTRALLLRAGIDLPLRVVRPEQHFLAMPRARVARKDDAAFGGPERELVDRLGPAEPRPVSAHPVLLDFELGYYTRCEPLRDRTRVGRIDYAEDREVDDPDRLDESVSDEFRRFARAQLERRMPVYRERTDREPEVGMYTLSPDAQALIGPLDPIEGLFVVSGFSGHGFKLSPSIGEGVAQMLAGDPVSAFDFSAGQVIAQGGAFGF